MCTDSCWVNDFGGFEPGRPRPCHHYFRCLLLPIPYLNQVKLLPSANLFNKPRPLATTWK